MRTHHALSCTMICFTMLASSCGKTHQDADTPKPNQGTRAASSAKKPQTATPRSDLDAATQDAIDLAIVSMAMSQSLNPLRVSDAIKQRFKKYEEGTPFKRSAKNINATFANGCVIHIEEGGEFITTFTGGLNAEVSFTCGEVGIQNGDIYVKDGTTTEVNKTKLVFRDGVWERQ